MEDEIESLIQMSLQSRNLNIRNRNRYATIKNAQPIQSQQFELIGPKNIQKYVNLNKFLDVNQS